jgi:hypothetical protein
VPLKGPGNYLISLDGVPVYIGEAMDVRQRLKSQPGEVPVLVDGGRVGPVRGGRPPHPNGTACPEQKKEAGFRDFEVNLILTHCRRF